MSEPTTAMKKYHVRFKYYEKELGSPSSICIQANGIIHDPTMIRFYVGDVLVYIISVENMLSIRVDQ